MSQGWIGELINRLRGAVEGELSLTRGQGSGRWVTKLPPARIGLLLTELTKDDPKPHDNPELRAGARASTGTVRWPDNWDQLDPLWRADVLRDWLVDINERYSQALADIRKGGPGS